MTAEIARTREDIKTTAREMLSDIGVSDPTAPMVESTAHMVSKLLRELDGDPTLNDYAGKITGYADSAAGSWDLSDVAGSVDFLAYKSQLCDGSESIARRVGTVAYEILSYVAAQFVNDHAPDPLSVPWSKIPTVSHGDVLVGRSATEGGALYVSVKVEHRDGYARLSITGHTSYSAGQCTDMLRADDIEPAPGLTLADLRKLADLWDHWHLNDMQAGCSHQRAIADKLGKSAHDVFITANTSREVDASGIARVTGYYGHGPDGKQVSRARTVCPICSYSYGSAWLREDVPADVLAFLERFTTAHDDKAREILRRDNPTEPGGEWSTYDLARALSGSWALFPSPRWETTREHFCAIARAAIGRIDPPTRFVGGVSDYLYHLPREVSS